MGGFNLLTKADDIPANKIVFMNLVKTCAVPLTLFLVIMIIFVWALYGQPFVWDDSAYLYQVSSPFVQKTIPMSVAACSPEAILYHGFADIIDTGYRPLSRIINLSFLCYYHDHAILTPKFWHVSVQAAIFAFLALAMYFIANLFIKNKFFSILVALFVLFSAPFISASWVMFAGIQAIVPMLFCLALLIYYKGVENREKLWPVILLISLLIIGSWFREFCGLISIIIIFSELIQKRFFSKYVIACIITFLFTVFPTVIPHYLFGLYKLPLISVLKVGNLNNQLVLWGGFSFVKFIFHLQWHLVSKAFLATIPPVLYLFFAIAICIERTQEFLKNKSAFSILFFIYCIIVAMLLCVPVNIAPVNMYKDIAYFLIVLLPVFASINIVIRFWYVICIIPFYKVYSEIVHLLYATVPLYIIIFYTYKNAFKKSLDIDLPGNNRFKVFKYMLFILLLLALFIGSIDQFYTFIGSRKVTRGTYSGIKDQAQWLKTQIPKGSSVICNAIHISDIALYSGNYFKPISTVQAGWRGLVISTPKQLYKYYNAGNRNLYILDANYDFLPGQRNYHINHFTHDYSVSLKQIGPQRKTKLYYAFFDPLRYIISREYQSYIGAPDLVNDFYTGRAFDKGLMWNKVGVTYTLYKFMPSSKALTS